MTGDNTPRPRDLPVPPLCGCKLTCGDDGDIDGPGVCKSLPVCRQPLVEVVLVHRGVSR